METGHVREYKIAVGMCGYRACISLHYSLVSLSEQDGVLESPGS